MMAAQASCVGASFVAGSAPPGRRAALPRAAVGLDATYTNPEANYVPNADKGGVGLEAGNRPEGSHGTGFRFMPISAVSKESAPALLSIAGVYPGITGQQLLTPEPLPFAKPGGWNYHRLTGDAVPTGFVALPGSHLLDSHPNTVAVVCSSPSLGLELADGQAHEVLALVDRDDEAVADPAAFQNSDFYAFADENDAVHIRWMQHIPPGWRIVGKLLYTQMPFVERPGAASGFAEMSDDFEF